MSMKSLFVLTGLGLVAGCTDPLLNSVPVPRPPDTSGVGCIDHDQDGYGVGSLCLGADCNDNDDRTFPGAAPNDSPTACMRDTDGDGYGDASATYPVEAGTDCDDGNSATHIQVQCYGDRDLDGFGAGALLARCTADGVAPAGCVLKDGDCDDGDDHAYPGAANKETDTAACMKDDDGDGYGDAAPPQGVTPGGDCDDTNASLNTQLVYGYRDGDGDGFGAGAKTPFCGTLGTGYVSNTLDCDDTNASLHTTVQGYADVDGDGYGAGALVAVCTSSGQLPAGYSGNSLDCDDTDVHTHPGAAVNEPYLSSCMKDDDGDGYGDSHPAFGITAGGDCDDGASYTFPGAAPNDSTTACMKDQDGDGYGDGSPAAGITPGSDCDDSASYTHPAVARYETNVDACMKDQDGDGYGDASPGVGITAGLDCDDSASYTYPGAAPADSTTDCMKDQDGDGYGDDSPGAVFAAGSDCDDADPSAFVLVEGYQDGDGDGFGGGPLLSVCGSSTGPLPPGWADSSTDCDDAAPYTYPGAAYAENATACMKDEDGDGYGDSAPSGGVDAGTDCDDSSPVTYPGAAVRDSGTACMRDADGDGYGDATPGQSFTVGSDCDDTDRWTYPGSYELPDDENAIKGDRDNDCDGANLLAATATTGVYVSATGSDTLGDGTAGNPYRTLGKAAASAISSQVVFVAGGDYPETTSVNVVRRFYGGYAPGDWTTRDPSKYTTRVHSAVTPVIGVPAGFSGLMQGFTIASDVTTGSGWTISMAPTGSVAATLALFDDVVLGPSSPSLDGSWAIDMNTAASGSLIGVRTRIVGGNASTTGAITSQSYGIHALGNQLGKLVLDHSEVTTGSSAMSYGVAIGGDVSISDSVITTGTGTSTATALDLGVSNMVLVNATIVNTVIRPGDAPTTYGIDASVSSARGTLRLVHSLVVLGRGASANLGLYVVSGTGGSWETYIGNSTLLSLGGAGAPDTSLQGSGPVTWGLRGNDLVPARCLLSDGGVCRATTAAQVNACTGFTCGSTAGNLSVDPMLVSLDPLDVHLQTNSPLRGAAASVPTSWLTVNDTTNNWYTSPGVAANDVDGDPRILLGGSGDIGPDEYVSTAPPTISGLAVNGGAGVSVGQSCPLTFTTTGATSYVVSATILSGTGSTAKVSPAKGYLPSAAPTLTYTAGSGSGAVMNVTVTVFGPSGQVSASISVPQA